MASVIPDFEYPLIDVGDGVEEHINGNIDSSIDHNDAEVSSGSDVELIPDAAVQAQTLRNQAHYRVLNNYLKASASTLTMQNGDAEDDHSQPESTSSGKIIDKVRKYQQELFERALEENVIAVLDTGSGKTLIACLLIRHMLTEELINRADGKTAKIVFFLANSVHLVQQQARVLADNLANKPVVFVGDEKAQVWKSHKIWPKIIAERTPVVCTPAVLRQCLDAALIRMDQISLLVFDEAHHAKKNHPYSLIIRSHYLNCDFDHRPRIFGMTASPVNSKADVNTNVADLEELLHCKIITTDDPSRLSIVPKPKDVVWKYDRLRPRFDTDLHCILHAKLGSFKDAQLQKGFTFSREATSTLGPWCANRVWKFIIGASEHEAAGLVKRIENSVGYSALESVRERENALHNVHEAIMQVLKSGYEMPTTSPSDLSPKVFKLYRELLERYTTQPLTRAIVFVDQRFTAQVLNDCFTKIGIENLRPATLLGAAHDSKSLKVQEHFLDRFRAGLINLIFATSVGDEGIDIPQCNLCIRFDLYKSPIQYIQSRGRARMKDSTYAHMIEEDNPVHRNEVRFAINTDNYLKEYCKSLEPDRLLGRGTKLEKMVTRDSGNKIFKTNAGVICDYENSLVILSRFASSLRYLGAMEKESYEEEIDEPNKLFRYVVRLPELKEIGFTRVRGEWKPNKQLAKRSAAWKCCFQLRHRGILDEALNSAFKKVKPENLNARLAISGKKSAYPMITKPSAWLYGLGKNPSRLYAVVIHVTSQKSLQLQYSPLVILTRVQLPSFPNFPIYIEDSAKAEVSITSYDQPFSVMPEHVSLLTGFTLDGVFSDVFNKVYELDSTQLSYWIAPSTLQPPQNPQQLSDIVNIETLEAVQLGRIRWSSDCKDGTLWTNRFICDPRDGKWHYFSDSITPGVSIFDPVPASIPRSTKRNMRNIIDFSDSFWKATKQNYIQATYDPDQPVISAKLMIPRRNFLEPVTDKGQVLIECLIAPQPLEVSRLEPRFAASCFLWPAVIHRLESYMIALEAFDHLALSVIPADLALEAFTKDNDNEDQENQTHIGGRHGMGKNYERLEFIGDSLLKMMTTITVFIRTKCDEEGMHCRRMEILCNRRLFEVSTEKHQLYLYVRAMGFNRLTWYPENLVQLKGRGAKKIPQPVKHPDMYQDLGMKTLADISEAIIGAAAISSQDSANKFDLGIKAITTLVDSDDHNIASWAELAEMYEAPEWSLGTNDVQANRLAQDIAIRTGYTFKYPRLLRSAFTHSSDTNATVPDLQRLEFLGDAVLDWVSIFWLFNQNPERNPQWLTEHKMAMVSNKFLAALAVKLDFDKFVNCSTAKLYFDISHYAKQVREVFAKEKFDRDFWTHIDSPPKALSDLVESYLGAVLVDSGFNYAEIEKFFINHVLWFFEDINQYDSFANRHPTTFLYKKLTDEFKCRDFNVICSNTDEGLVETRVTAGVIIHNKVIADSSGVSAKYAKVRASHKALAKLDGMTTDDFRNNFGCYCKVTEQ